MATERNRAMTYKTPTVRDAVRIAKDLNRSAPDGIQYRARRYPDPDSRGFMRVTWGVVKLERVPESLRRIWPDGFKPCGFVWLGV